MSKDVIQTKRLADMLYYVNYFILPEDEESHSSVDSDRSSSSYRSQYQLMYHQWIDNTCHCPQADYLGDSTQSAEFWYHLSVSLRIYIDMPSNISFYRCNPQSKVISPVRFFVVIACSLGENFLHRPS